MLILCKMIRHSGRAFATVFFVKVGLCFHLLIPGHGRFFLFTIVLINLRSLRRGLIRTNLLISGLIRLYWLLNIQ